MSGYYPMAVKLPTLTDPLCGNHLFMANILNSKLCINS